MDRIIEKPEIVYVDRIIEKPTIIEKEIPIETVITKEVEKIVTVEKEVPVEKVYLSRMLMSDFGPLSAYVRAYRACWYPCLYTFGFARACVCVRLCIYVCQSVWVSEKMLCGMSV